MTPRRLLGKDASPPERDVGDLPLDARRVLAVSRSLRPGLSWKSVAQTIYMVALTLGISAGLFWGFWTYAASVLVDLARPYRVLWGPPALALVLLATLRYNTLQGFASYSETDCLLLLGAPVPRRDLVILRLRRIAIATASAGAVIGAIAGLASEGLDIGADRMAAAVVAGVATSVVVVALGWQVQRLPRLALWVTRLTIPALGVVALLALAARWGGSSALVALLSGPWGWAALPFATTHWAWSVAGPLALAVLAAVGWVAVRRTAGSVSIESFGVRAQVRSNAVAGLWAMDARALVLAGRQSSGGSWKARIALRVPRRPEFVVCWHGLLLLLRSPMRLGWAAFLAAGGAIVLGMDPGRAGTSWAGALLLYLSASALMEPIRVEMDSPATASMLLPWKIGTVLQLHCLVPAIVVFGSGIIGVVIGWAVGLMPAGAVAGVAVLVVMAAVVQVLAAGLSAKRGGRLPHEMLLVGAGDVTGFSALTIVGWVFGWTIVGVAAIAIAASLALDRSDDSAWAIATSAVVLLVLAAILWARLAKPPSAQGKQE